MQHGMWMVTVVMDGTPLLGWCTHSSLSLSMHISAEAPYSRDVWVAQLSTCPSCKAGGLHDKDVHWQCARADSEATPTRHACFLQLLSCP